MPVLFAIAFAGFFAQLVDGSLGMGYGVTSTTLLLGVGLAPAAASASVHLAEIGTTGMSGIAHWRLGNVDGKVLLLVGVPGGIGGFLGAVVLSNLSLDAARPTVSVILLALGAVILARFIHGRRAAARGAEPIVPGLGRPRWMLLPLGLVGGFVDATGGGGWGPVTTSTLMAATSMRPRTIVGTVSGSEFIVSVSASLGFLLALGSAGIDPGIVVALLLGGALAAPLAAYIVSRFDEGALGTAVGGLLIFLNLDRGMSLFGVEPAYGLVLRFVVVSVSVVIVAFRLWRRRATSILRGSPDAA
jgi:uncharacterized membrane protein YfcA